MNPFTSINPATGELLWEGTAAGKTEINNAFERANKAQRAWEKTSFQQRVQHLLQFQEQLKKAKESFARTISLETGKPLWESQAEVDAMAGKIPISISSYETRCKELTQVLPTGTACARHKPHGIVAVFGPFNFPGHLPNGHIVPALLAGNAVLFKPSELSPLVAQKTGELWEKSGLPPHLLQLIQGGKETGELLAHHPSLNGLYFTGSVKTGLLLANAFSRHPEKILALELGGNNPLIIGEISDLKAAVFSIIQSAFLTSGQRCTCARRLILPEGTLGDRLLEELKSATLSLKIGPFDATPEPFMGPLIRATAAHSLLKAEQSLIALGARQILPLKKLALGEAFLSPGILDMTPVVSKPDEELFGPLLQVIRVPHFTAALEEANRTAYGLSAGLLSDREEEYRAFYEQVRAGVLNWNAPLTGASSQMPFGGVGISGNHRPSAFYAADYCAYPVASIENKSLKLPSLLPPGVSL